MKLIDQVLNTLVTDDLFTDLIEALLIPDSMLKHREMDQRQLPGIVMDISSSISQMFRLRPNIVLKNGISAKHALEVFNFIIDLAQLKRSTGLERDHIASSSKNRSLFVQEVVGRALEKADTFRCFDEPVVEEKLRRLRYINGIVQRVKTIVDVMNEYDKFAEELQSASDILTIINRFQSIVHRSYTILGGHGVSGFNTLVLGPDSIVLKRAADAIVEHLRRGYSLYKTGFTFIDETLDGLESSAVHLIAGPSNHGKSLFAINLLYQMIKNNTFTDPDSTIIFITTEDDVFRLARRICGVFGNMYTRDLKNLYDVLSNNLKQQSDENALDHAKWAMYKVFERALSYAFTGSHNAKDIGSNCNVSIVLRHVGAEGFTPADLTTMLDDYTNVIAVFIDYIDLMAPSKMPTNMRYSEYEKQGDIVQELRVISREKHIPIIAVTQNQRAAEDYQQILANRIIGESYRKVKFADYIYMLRQREDLYGIEGNGDGESFDNANVILDARRRGIDPEHYIPMEIKITKAKEGSRSSSYIYLFCKDNTRIYEKAEDLEKDLEQLEHVYVEELLRAASMETHTGYNRSNLGLLGDNDTLDNVF